MIQIERVDLRVLEELAKRISEDDLDRWRDAMRGVRPIGDDEFSAFCNVVRDRRYSPLAPSVRLESLEMTCYAGTDGIAPAVLALAALVGLLDHLKSALDPIGVVGLLACFVENCHRCGGSVAAVALGDLRSIFAMTKDGEETRAWLALACVILDKRRERALLAEAVRAIESFLRSRDAGDASGAMTKELGSADRRSWVRLVRRYVQSHAKTIRELEIICRWVMS